MSKNDIQLMVICAIIAAFPTAYLVIQGLDDSDPCTCRFQQHRVHFGDNYTKTNRKCIDLGNGSVQAGDTVYLDVKWFTNECQ